MRGIWSPKVARALRQKAIPKRMESMNSVLTNNGAMTALQVLNSVNKDLGVTQGRISTGLKVATADQNAAIFAIAGTMKADVAGFETIQEGLGLAESAVSVARSASESISDLLKEMKQKIITAQDGNVDRTKIQADIDELVGQVSSIVETATFNGINYLKGGDEVSVLSSLDRSTSDGAHFTVTASSIDFEQQNLIGGVKPATETIVAAGVTAEDAVASKYEINATSLIASMDGAAADNDTFTIQYVDEDGVTQTVANAIDFTSVDGSAGAQAQLGQVIAALDTAFSGIDPTIVVSHDALTNKISVYDQAGRNYTLSLGGTDGTASNNLGSNFTTVQQGTAVRNSEASYAFDPGEVDFDTTNAGGASQYVAGETFTKITLTQKDGTQLVVDLTDTTSTSSAAMRAIADSDTAANIATALQTDLNTASTAASTGVTYTVSYDASDNSFKVVDDKGEGVVLDFEGKGFGKLGNLTNIDVTTESNAKTSLGRIETMIQSTLDSAAALGSTQKRLSIQRDFLSKLNDALKTGIGTLVDADMTSESARLQSLQVQQQLATQALSIANQQPQGLLALFR
jgi:flagellin